MTNELTLNVQFEFPEINFDFPENNKEETFEWNVKNMMDNVKITFPKKNKTDSKPKINISQYRAGYDE